MKYLMTFMGVSSGTYMGRDDGHPEKKSMVIHDTDELVATFRPDAEYFKLTPVKTNDIAAAVKAIKDLNSE